MPAGKTGTIDDRLRCAERVAQGLVSPGCLSELHGELREQGAATEVPACSGDLVAQDFGVGEVLQEGDDIGERFMEGVDIRVGGFGEVDMHPVQNGVGHFMSDDVVGETGKDHATGIGVSGVGVFGGEVAKEDRPFLRRVVGVPGAEGMRVEAETLDKLIAQIADLFPGFYPGSFLSEPGILAGRIPGAQGRPEEGATQGIFKVPDRLHGDGIDHLLMELRVAFGAGKTIAGEEVGMVQVDREIGAIGGGVDIHDFEVFAHGSGLQILFKEKRNRDFVERDRFHPGGEAGIKGEDPEASFIRWGDRVLVGGGGWHREGGIRGRRGNRYLFVAFRLQLFE